MDKSSLITAPPALVLPENPDAYGEIWLKYPSTRAPVPVRFEQTFRAVIEFRTIMNEITNSMFPSPGPKQPISMPQALAYRSRLQHWYERLPDHLEPKNLIIPAHFHIQYVTPSPPPCLSSRLRFQKPEAPRSIPNSMHYWLTIARLFEDTEPQEDDEYDAASSPSLLESPRSIATHAETCLQTLIRLYYSSHGGDGYDFFMVLLAVFIGFSSLGDASVVDGAATALRETNESSAVLCAYILHGQSRMVYLAEIVFRVMQKSSPAHITNELARLINVSDDDEERTRLVTRQVQSAWPINVKQLSKDTNARRLENLYRAIAELSVEDDSSLAGSPSQGNSPAP